MPLLYVWNDNISPGMLRSAEAALVGDDESRLTEPALIAGFLSAGECRALVAEIDAAHRSRADLAR